MTGRVTDVRSSDCVRRPSACTVRPRKRLRDIAADLFRFALICGHWKRAALTEQGYVTPSGRRLASEYNGEIRQSGKVVLCRRLHEVRRGHTLCIAGIGASTLRV
jgi:hypothetical protein